MIEYRRLNRTTEALEPVWRLTHDAYVGQGYAEYRSDGILRHYPHLDLIRETTVLAAFDGERIVGTNSLTMDGPAGLHVDGVFPKETAEARTECLLSGQQLGASWRIATAERDASLLLGLIGFSVEVAADLGLDVVLFAFHPRHARIYAKLLDLEVITSPQPEPAVLGSPAVLMRGEMGRIVRRWEGRQRV